MSTESLELYRTLAPPIRRFRCTSLLEIRNGTFAGEPSRKLDSLHPSFVMRLTANRWCSRYLH